MEPYYEQRAAEYDEWYTGEGQFAARDRPGWDEDVRALLDVVGSLAPVRMLDVACGTGFLTQAFRGDVVGVDSSPAMLATSRARHPHPLVLADAFTLPFRDRVFDRVFAGRSRCLMPSACSGCCCLPSTQSCRAA